VSDMKKVVTIRINKRDYPAEIETRMLLVQFIRGVAGLTGTHVGCDTGHCGACTVLVNSESIKSCMMLAVQAEGSEVMTLEGLAGDASMRKLQETFRSEFAVQCGFCTPGLLISALDLLSKNPNPTEDQVKEGIAGNICRCEGYPSIVRAIRKASESAKSGTEIQE
jgi:carbon-monoxide dehydrogenase small subunit